MTAAGAEAKTTAAGGVPQPQLTKRARAGSFSVGRSATLGGSGSGSGMRKCQLASCMSFAQKGEWCLRHCWKEDIVDVEAQQNPKMAEVANEILATERVYNQGLRLALDNLTRLRTLVELGKPVISTEQIDQIFGNIEEVHRLSVELLTDLDELRNEKMLMAQITGTLLHYAPAYRIYQAYLENYDSAIKLLQSLRKTLPEFDFFVKWNEKCDGSSLEAQLVLPIQRLPRYQLLLTELKEATPEDEPAREEIEEAVDRIVNVSQAINESLHLKEAVERVRLLSLQFEKDSRFMDFVTPTRVLVKDGPLKKKYSAKSRQLQGSKTYHFFLFNDILLYASASKGWNTTTYRLKHFHPLSDMDIDTRLDPKKEGKDKLDIRIWAGRSLAKGKAFVVTCADEQDRQEWIKALTECINKARDVKNVRTLNFDGSKSTGIPQNAKFARMMGLST